MKTEPNKQEKRKSKRKNGNRAEGTDTEQSLKAAKGEWKRGSNRAHRRRVIAIIKRIKLLQNPTEKLRGDLQSVKNVEGPRAGEWNGNEKLDETTNRILLLN